MSTGEPPVIGGGQPLSTRIKGWTFGLALFLSSFFGSIYIASPIVLLMFFNPLLYRDLFDKLIGAWVLFPSGLIKILFGANVQIKGHFIDYSTPALIIMNHRTRLDWMFFWTALYRMDPKLCTTEKISLKGVLKFVPGAGWAMQAASYIFLDRSFEKDEKKIDKILKYYAESGNYQLLLFPEGTDKCPKATERGKLYVEKNNLQMYDYCLHPRIRGFVHIVQQMRKNNNIKFLYDVTIGFGDAIVQSEVDIVVNGVCPKDIQYQVVKIPIEDLPMDDDGLGKWLVKQWKEKEEKLKRFYNKPIDERQFENVPNGNTYEWDNQLEITLNAIVGIWIFVTLFWIYMFFESAIMFYYAIFICIFYIGVHKFYNGLEFLAIDVFNKKKTYTIVETVNN